MRFKFLQIADIHLGFKIKGIDRIKYCKEALLKAVNFIKDFNLDALLIAGDLFENDKIYREDIEFLKDIFESIYPKPVVISPGNHDFLGFNCAYDEKLLNLIKLKAWPENVKIFRTPEFSFFPIGEVNIYGKPCLNRETKAFDEIVRLNTSKINIALIHASRINFKPPNKEIWNPFDDVDILKSNFDYIALGHYHSYSEIKDDSGIKASYSGSMVPASLDEYGKRGGLIVDIVKENNKITVETEFVALSDFSIKKVEISPTQSIERFKNIVSNEIKESENPYHTLFILKIKGMGDLNLIYLKELFSEYKILFDTSEFIRINIDKLKQTHPDTTIGTFINEMIKLIENADDKEKQILQDALIFGLDAFAGKQIIPRFYNEN